MRVFDSREWRSLLWTAVLCAVGAAAILALKPVAARGQCLGGQCPSYRQPDVRVQAPGVDVRVQGQPRPAWRYERPERHRQAIVRVICQDDYRTRSIGSGVIVRWGKRLVVLTARHVVQDAKRIIIETFRKKTYRVRVVRADATWDCAVLAFEDAPPEDVAAADLEWGEDAMQRPGNRLESCGYGPDGRLAVNSGLFQGYRRSSNDPENPPDDWMELSGRARQGDSGGPIFNERGRVVGVLWGTDGERVVGVQAGRIHAVLASVYPGVTQQVFYVPPPDNEPVVAIDPADYLLLQYQRRPTPPLPGPVLDIGDLPPADAPQCTPGSGCCPTGQSKPGALLPWRGGAEKRDADLDARVKALLEALEAERANRQAAEAQKPPVELPVPPPIPTPAVDDGPKPLVVVLLIVGAVCIGVVVFYMIQKN